LTLDLYARHPDLVIDLVDSDANLNIARHEADVAIRVSRPESGDFIIRKLAVAGFAVYESARPEVVTGRDDWVAYNEELAQVPEMRWLEAHLEGGRIRLRDSGVQTLCGAVASGVSDAAFCPASWGTCILSCADRRRAIRCSHAMCGCSSTARGASPPASRSSPTGSSSASRPMRTSSMASAATLPRWRDGSTKDGSRSHS
jgi:hypothetical protein